MKRPTIAQAERALCDMQTLTLSGCGQGRCLDREPLRLCARCESALTRIAVLALTGQYEGFPPPFGGLVESRKPLARR